jgi:hypothetical protein
MSWQHLHAEILSALLLISVPSLSGAADGDEGRPTNKGVDLRSHARELRDEVRAQGLAQEFGVPSGVSAPLSVQGPSALNSLANVQVNDPALDNIKFFPGTRPFESSIQSETSIAAFGDDIVVGYNSSADQLVVQDPVTGALRRVFIHFSGFSASHDGGKTWVSGFVPPNEGSVFTFGDPSVGVDRAGNFYYASLGVTALGNGAVLVNKSTDRGATFAPAMVAAEDNGSDKEWLAIGPDPVQPSRDNLYVAWTSFQEQSSQLSLARSTDGGSSWESKTLFAPEDGGPTGMSTFIQFANPVVDASNGRLYIPFLHFSNFDADFIKVLVSDDAGETFRFLRFDVVGAPDPFGFPNVTPGVVSDCGSPGGGIRIVLRQGPDLGGGRFGLPRFRQSTRLTTQPAAAAAQGKLFIAFNSSTSPISGDPSSRSEIRLLFSPDGGETWAPAATVAAASDAEPQHVFPAIAVDNAGQQVHVAYYAQQGGAGQLRVDLASGTVEGRSFVLEELKQLSSVAFDLTPSNNPIPTAASPFAATNYDRTIAVCYNLGEYLDIRQSGDQVIAAWGDNRNPWTSPPGSPAAGVHPQPDVFFQAISTQ